MIRQIVLASTEAFYEPIIDFVIEQSRLNIAIGSIAIGILLYSALNKIYSMFWANKKISNIRSKAEKSSLARAVSHPRVATESQLKFAKSNSSHSVTFADTLPKSGSLSSVAQPVIKLEEDKPQPIPQDLLPTTNELDTFIWDWNSFANGKIYELKTNESNQGDKDFHLMKVANQKFMRIGDERAYEVSVEYPIKDGKFCGIINFEALTPDPSDVPNLQIVYKDGILGFYYARQSMLLNIPFKNESLPYLREEKVMFTVIDLKSSFPGLSDDELLERLEKLSVQIYYSQLHVEI